MSQELQQDESRQFPKIVPGSVFLGDSRSWEVENKHCPSKLIFLYFLFSLWQKKTPHCICFIFYYPFITDNNLNWSNYLAFMNRVAINTYAYIHLVGYESLGNIHRSGFSVSNGSFYACFHISQGTFQLTFLLIGKKEISILPSIFYSPFFT